MAKKATSMKTARSGRAKRKELPKDTTDMSEEERMAHGIKLFDQGTYLASIEVFSGLVHSKNHLARQYLARCYYRLFQYDLAYLHFSYLAEHAEGTMRDYGTTMTASIEMMRGNYGEAIKRMRVLPENPRNIINLALAYWKKYTVQKDEFSAREALALLQKIKLNALTPNDQQIVYHLMGLIHQSQKEYFLASRFYQKAIDISNISSNLGAILNDYASLYIEKADFNEAINLLNQARELVTGNDDIEEAFNNKWFGILASIHNRHEEAVEYLQKAAKVIHSRDLFKELANILYILADSKKNTHFYKAAEYFANGLNYEKLSEEVNERDEKIVKFYYYSFFSDHGNASGIG